MARIIEASRSVVVAADVPTCGHLDRLMCNIHDVPGIGGVKIGLTTVLSGGLYAAVAAAKNYQDYLGRPFPIIYDHQKAGNDIPDMGKPFATVLKEAGVDAAILFPFTGPATQEAWMRACQEVNLEVIVGGMMTHPEFLVSEGGYINNGTPERIYRMACQCGITNFVVPGTKLEWVKQIRAWIEWEIGEGGFTLYAPGFITQGGGISECGRAAGEEWHAIVGSAIYKKKTAEEQREAALAATKQIAA